MLNKKLDHTLKLQTMPHASASDAKANGPDSRVKV